MTATKYKLVYLGGLVDEFSVESDEMARQRIRDRWDQEKYGNKYLPRDCSVVWGLHILIRITEEEIAK